MNNDREVESTDKNFSSKCNRRNRNMDMKVDKGMHMSDRFPIGMAYVPWQHWGSLYEPEKALKVGTIFPELNKPYYGKRGNCPW